MVPFHEYGIVREEKLFVVCVQSPCGNYCGGDLRAGTCDLSRDRVVEVEGNDRLNVVLQPEVEYERRVGNQENHLLLTGTTRSAGDLADLLHEERLILRVQIEFWFVDDEVTVLMVIQVSQENDELLDAVTFITVEPIGFATFSTCSLRYEVAGIPLEDHITAKEMAESRFYLNAQVHSVFEQQDRVNPRSFRACLAKLVERTLGISGTEVIAPICPHCPWGLPFPSADPYPASELRPDDS